MYATTKKSSILIYNPTTYLLGMYQPIQPYI